MLDKTLLVIGCGFLGACFAARYARDFAAVYLSSRAPEKLRTLENELKKKLAGKHIHRLSLDLNDEASWSSLAVLPSTPLAVCCLVTPSQVDGKRFAGFLSYLDGYPISRAVLSSSTVVYGTQAAVVDSDSALSLDGERARRQHALEHSWHSHLRNACIVRLAGLYGPGRIIGQGRLVAGGALPGRAGDWLNLIHIDDAAALIKAMLDSDIAGPELGCDDSPARRGEYYTALAQCLRLNPPLFSGDDADRRPGRRCSNVLTKARLGWQPAYRSYRQFFAELWPERIT